MNNLDLEISKTFCRKPTKDDVWAAFCNDTFTDLRAHGNGQYVWKESWHINMMVDDWKNVIKPLPWSTDARYNAILQGYMLKPNSMLSINHLDESLAKRVKKGIIFEAVLDFCKDKKRVELEGHGKTAFKAIADLYLKYIKEIL